MNSSTSTSNQFIIDLLSNRKVVATAFSIGTILGAGIGYGFVKALPSYSSRVPEAYVTSADYERIQLEMTLTDVQAILGRGTEVYQSQHASEYIWVNPNDSKIEAKFENNVLVEKRQVDL